MNKKIYLKTNIIGFIVGAFIFGSLAVYAAVTFPSNEVSYDNLSSGLSSTNVKGAIDELYKTCTATAGGSILDKEPIVTTGDGLYEDEYEEGKYTYKGANPNNYVTFNNEEAGWRIISINSDGSIKIMRDASIEQNYWDTSGSYGNNNWNRPATLNTYLNEDYYNSLTSIAQNQIVESSYYVGAVTEDNNDMQDQISDEKLVVSNIKIALPTVSEYIRSNSNTSSCGTYSSIDKNHITCENTTWMFNDAWWWTLSPVSDSSSRVFAVYPNGYIPSIYSNGYSYFNGSAHYTDFDVRPVVTLSSSVKITGGTGTKSDPHVIE